MQKPIQGLIQDAGGVPLGHVETNGRELVKREVEWIRAFLIGLKTKQQGVENDMGPKVNIVKLSGKVKNIKVNDDGTGAFCLVDSETEDCRFIPCTIFKSVELVKRLQTFDTDEYIQIIGMIRAWSKKVGERQYENRVEVRISEIKNIGTMTRPATRSQGRFQSDEEPF